MKTSPLQLKWLNYISASYELRDFGEDEEAADVQVPLSVSVEPEVEFRADRRHIVILRIRTREGNSGAYNASIAAMAEFDFDLDIAKREYRPKLLPALANIIAVNVARIVYASAREHLAMLTSRAPFGAALIESVLLEPGDVRIRSDQRQEELLRTLFGASDDEVLAYMGPPEAPAKVGEGRVAKRPKPAEKNGPSAKVAKRPKADAAE